MSLFKRVFNTQAKSEQITPVDMAEPELDRAWLEEAGGDLVVPEAEMDAPHKTETGKEPRISEWTVPDEPGDPEVGPADDGPSSELQRDSAPDVDATQKDASHADETAPMRRAPAAPDPEDCFPTRDDFADVDLGGDEPEEGPSCERSSTSEDPLASPRKPVNMARMLVSPPSSEPAPSDDRPSGPGARRVRTRMLGVNQGMAGIEDPIEKVSGAVSRGEATFPVGWVVVVEGAGRGHAFPLFSGVCTIGRGEDQTVVLDMGDTSISRQKHASIAYDPETRGFYIGHGGKSNIVRLNGRPVLSTEDLKHGDTIRIGETTLRFVALCDEGFAWEADGDADAE